MASTDRLAETYVDKIKSVCSAVVDHDVERILAHFDDNCVFVDGGTGQEGGKDSLIGFLEEMWSTFPDYTPRVAAAHVDENTIGVVFELTGTLPAVDAPATSGKKMRWLATAFSTFDPDSLAITRDIYFVDAAALEQMLSIAQTT
ncbi:nuclear transport factor 2 family protein [Saccharopolyspora tripterygii]